MPSDENHQPIRVLIVDDSFFMRKMLREMLSGMEGVEVVDTASNGLEAIEKNRALQPDVLTLDVEMPKLDGLAALERIMREAPVPVVMLSSHTGKGTETTLKALEMGAVDCLLKPSGKPIGDLDLIRDELFEKIKWAARSKSRVATLAGDMSRTPVRGEREKPTPPKVPTLPSSPRPAKTLVAVASSTGGPRSLQDLFRDLPSDLPAACVVVQHISVGFTKALARRLDDVSALTAMEAVEGEVLMEGHIYVAPAGKHLVVTGTPRDLRIGFKDDPPRLGVKPSGDLMMVSVAKAVGKDAIGVVLTGMGKDGTEGAKAIQKAGGRTFAQSEATCVVYGMPKSAVESKVVDEQADPAGIARRLTDILTRS